MYQLLCHVNVPVPADTCLTRTADRAILDFVPAIKRTVVFIRALGFNVGINITKLFFSGELPNTICNNM